MCRLLLAIGRFSSERVLDAAVMMSRGETADHESPFRVHPHGWGAVWRRGGELFSHRDVRRIDEGRGDFSAHESGVELLAVHVRHATLARNHGLACTHPLERPGRDGPWFLFHNGFLPTVYQQLGRTHSEFDSAEYFDYLVPEPARSLDVEAAAAKLRALPPGGSSANAIVVNPDCAYVIHWTPEDTRYPRYFTMHKLVTREYTIIASEPIPALAARECWTPLEQRTIHAFPLQ